MTPRLTPGRVWLRAAALLVTFGSAAMSWANVPNVTELRIEPTALVIAHERDARRLLVSGLTESGEWVDLTHDAELVAPPEALRIDADGYVHPVAAGKASLSVSAGGQRATVAVTVEGVAPPSISFVREVMPQLSKLGCNAGTCHGAAKGKNGFRLSLRGYDPDSDYHALIQDISGRRFNRAFPNQSLMLLKPTADVPHKGGQVITPGSADYELLKTWIEEGVVSDVGATTRVERLEVLPAAVDIAMPGMQQQVLVLAHYARGGVHEQRP